MQPSPPARAPRIAIIGAGPAGATLARLLQSFSSSSPIDVTVFEGETSLSVRAQGGTLDLHTSTGQRALRECGLYEDFLRYARFDGEAMTVCDGVVEERGGVLLRIGGTQGDKSSRGRPEIDRVQLRRLLVESLREGTVKWGYRLKKAEFVEEKEGSDVILEFENGKVERGFDLVVGADGAWSRIRPLLSDAKPYYVGLGGHGIVVTHPESVAPELAKLVNRGSVFAFGAGHGLSVQQRGDDSLIAYAWNARDEKWMQQADYNIHDGRQVKEALKKDYAGWKGPLRQAIEFFREDDVLARNLYELPAGHRWDARPKVTCIGDAAHVMTPFAGEGVNLAMKDAMELAHAIVDAVRAGVGEERLRKGIRRFEEGMFKSAEPISRLSHREMELMFFTEGAPSSTIDLWLRNALGGRHFDAWWFKWLVPLWLVKGARWLFGGKYHPDG